MSPFYESDRCYLAEVLFKTAIKGQKTISVPHQYRYGFCKKIIEYQKPYLYLAGIDMVFGR